MNTTFTKEGDLATVKMMVHERKAFDSVMGMMAMLAKFDVKDAEIANDAMSRLSELFDEKNTLDFTPTEVEEPDDAAPGVTTDLAGDVGENDGPPASPSAPATDFPQNDEFDTGDQ